jgi:hypothetical protein
MYPLAFYLFKHESDVNAQILQIYWIYYKAEEEDDWNADKV